MTDRNTPHPGDLSAVAQRARQLYAERVAGMQSTPWWTAVVITAGSARQADRYKWELLRRQEQGRLPCGVPYLVAPDPGDQRVGTGAATVNALRVLATTCLFEGNGQRVPGSLPVWWANQRVLIINAGGDSRRLPQYSLSGKLFSAVPVKTPWGETSTVFDEILALSSTWAENLPGGLMIGPGDVLVTFDAASVNWHRPGVTGIAMLQSAELGARHGVYIADERDRVYAFLQKPSMAELCAAGGVLPGERVALDVGLLRFAPDAATRLMELAGVHEDAGALILGTGIVDDTTACKPLGIEASEHFTGALTGQWAPRPDDSPALHAVAASLRGLPFWCSTVEGEFAHVGTTTLFRKLLTEQTEFSNLYAAQQRTGATKQPGLRSAGVVLDSVLSGGGEVGAGAVVIECNLQGWVRAAAGSVLHGLENIAAVDIPEDTVVHHIPVAMLDGRRGSVIRVYGVADDPNTPAAAWKATWFGRPMIDELRNLGMDLARVWPGLPPDEWTLWNAQLFPVTTMQEAWDCARWFLRLTANGFSVERWGELPRASLATSAQWADNNALQAAYAARRRSSWEEMAVSLSTSGADIRPLLVHAPGTRALADAAQKLSVRARDAESADPTEAAHLHYLAGMFFGQAGVVGEAESSRTTAFRIVSSAVQAGAYGRHFPPAAVWRRKEVTVQGPARIDMGGGWSDTPPFCLDWGGTVLNVAVQLNGGYPISTTIRRIAEPLIRCHTGDGGKSVEYHDCSEILRRAFPGDPFAIPGTALQMMGIFREHEPLEAILDRAGGGGLEIRTAVKLPMGSGLGTSSILAATTVRALFEILGEPLDDGSLSDQVMRLEQLMTTGGGWQDQAGGIFPGAKLAISGPGLSQHLRVQPVPFEAGADLESLMVLYYTGIRRIARDLLQQVVGSYLARETATVQVLHSIKTLAMEMAYAMQERDWDQLGKLLDRHWELNQILDPNTTNAPINTLLRAVRPYIRGAKLAGAGGGGFLMLLARSAEQAGELRRFLETNDIAPGGAVYDWRIATEGLRVTHPAAGSA